MLGPLWPLIHTHTQTPKVKNNSFANPFGASLLQISPPHLINNIYLLQGLPSRFFFFICRYISIALSRSVSRILCSAMDICFRLSVCPTDLCDAALPSLDLVWTIFFNSNDLVPGWKIWTIQNISHINVHRYSPTEPKTTLYRASCYSRTAEMYMDFTSHWGYIGITKCMFSTSRGPRPPSKIQWKVRPWQG